MTGFAYVVTAQGRGAPTTEIIGVRMTEEAAIRLLEIDTAGYLAEVGEAYALVTARASVPLGDLGGRVLRTARVGLPKSSPRRTWRLSRWPID